MVNLVLYKLQRRQQYQSSCSSSRPATLRFVLLPASPSPVERPWQPRTQPPKEPQTQTQTHTGTDTGARTHASTRTRTTTHTQHANHTPRCSGAVPVQSTAFFFSLGENHKITKSKMKARKCKHNTLTQHTTHTTHQKTSHTDPHFYETTHTSHTRHPFARFSFAFLCCNVFQCCALC